MTNLDRVTITGADGNTDPNDLLRIWERYSFVEFGILLSPHSESGGYERFPGSEWTKRLARAVAEHHRGFTFCPVSLHLCGGYVRNLLDQGWNSSWGIHTEIWDVAQRVQLNFHGIPHGLDMDAFSRELFRYPDLQFIFQIDGTPNKEHFLYALGSAFNAVPLFDTSGGAGVLPGGWPPTAFTQNNRPLYHGYAGGLGPDVIEDQLPLIEAAADEAKFWIDMEGQVRTNEVLDLDKVERVLQVCERYMGLHARVI